MYCTLAVLPREVLAHVYSFIEYWIMDEASGWFTCDTYDYAEARVADRWNYFVGSKFLLLVCGWLDHQRTPPLKRACEFDIGVFFRSAKRVRYTPQSDKQHLDKDTDLYDYYQITDFWEQNRFKHWKDASLHLSLYTEKMLRDVRCQLKFGKVQEPQSPNFSLSDSEYSIDIWDPLRLDINQLSRNSHEDVSDSD